MLSNRRTLTEPSRGEDYCSACGSHIKWIRLMSGRWVAVEPEPVLYLDGGRNWLIEDRSYDADIKKNCRIWRPGMLLAGVHKGYKPHAWECDATKGDLKNVR